MADPTEDTQPLPLSACMQGPQELPVNRADAESVEATASKVPEPALIRAFLVAAVGLVGAVVGKQLDLAWIDPAITVYAVSAPIALGWWIRRHVSPVPK